jgi:hypothetical protein
MHHAIKKYGGMEVQLHVFLTSVLNGIKWSALRPGRFTDEVRGSGTHWGGLSVGPKPVWLCEEEKNLLPMQGIKILSSDIQLSARHYTD